MSSIVIGRIDLLEELILRISPFKVVLLTNEVLAKLWLPNIPGNFDDVIVMPDGEKHKNVYSAIRIWNRLHKIGFTRKSLLIGLGGGVITDLAGFVASTYMRGTYLGFMPTTLLAMVDAAIGGKTGVNFNGKNLLGTFYLPDFVLIDLAFLRTLPKEELVNGFGEVVKYGVLDEEVYNMLEKLRSVDQIEPRLIKKCIDVKLRIVKEDLKERGKRMLLNLGHTLGHAIEKVSKYSVKHGLAVTIGLMGSALIGEKLYGFDAHKVERLLDRFGLPKIHSFNPQALLEAVKLDKKAWYGKPVFVIPIEIGKLVIARVDENLILEVLERLRAR